MVFVLVKWMDEGQHSIVPGNTLDRCASLVTAGEMVKVKLFQGAKPVFYEAEVIAKGKCMFVQDNLWLLIRWAL